MINSELITSQKKITATELETVLFIRLVSNHSGIKREKNITRHRAWAFDVWWMSGGRAGRLHISLRDEATWFCFQAFLLLQMQGICVVQSWRFNT